MQLYADEDFPQPTVLALRAMGHDVLTAKDDGLLSTPDPLILARAHSLGRILLTHNRRHYEPLHRRGDDHSGIVSAKQGFPHLLLATMIDAALSGLAPGRWCIRVNRPPTARRGTP